MKKYKLALTNADFATPSMPILLTGDISENLKKAAGLGADGLEIHLRETAVLDYGAIKDTMAKHGIKIACVVTGKLNTLGKVDLMDLRPYITKAAIKGMRQYTKMAKELETDLVVGWLRGSIPKDGIGDYHIKELVKNLKTVCEFAAESGVRVFLEVINRYETNMFNTCKETLDFISQFEIPNCLIHLDTFHMNIEESDPAAAIRLAGDLLGHFHVADNTRLCPGSGSIDFKSQIDALIDIGYEGYVSVECLPGADGYETAKTAMAFFKGL